MDIVNTITDTATDVTKLPQQVYTGAKSIVASNDGRMNMVYATGGLVVASLAGGLMTWIPFQKIPAGNLIRTGSLAFVGAGLFGHGVKHSGEALGMATLVAGPILFGTAIAQVMGLFGLFPRLQSVLTKDAESGYGGVGLSNYAAIDSVEVDRTSYQPTQDYGAETIEQQMTSGSPQVQIAERQEGDPLNTVREEAPIGHGVTQWFGSESANSSRPSTRLGSMKSFAASTDTFGNKITTGDDSMANVVGPTSLADVPATTASMYDVQMESGPLPTTREVGGTQDVFATYILPSFEKPSAGSSGHGVTQWYAESNQTGFIGRFVAGAEGHGSVLGQ
jgi:hypothetical protein